MKRCKHLNGDLIEHILIEHAKPVLNGVVDSIGYNSTGDTVKSFFRCADCGKDFPYVGTPDARWLRKLDDQVHDM